MYKNVPLILVLTLMLGVAFPQSPGAEAQARQWPALCANNIKE